MTIDTPKDNVTRIHSLGAPPAEVGEIRDDEPDWLKTANQLGRDFENDSKPPMATDPTIGSDYDPVADRRTGAEIPASVSREDVDQVGALAERLPKARSLSRAEREAQDVEARRLVQETERQRIADEKELAADAARFEEVDPQRRAPFLVALALAITIFATSALFSFPAVAATAALMLPVWGFLVWVVPGFVEAFVIYFGIETVIWQARATNTRRYSEPQRLNAQKMSDGALIWMLVFTGVSVVSNGAHTYMGYEALDQLGTWQAWLGIALAALAPLSVVLITKRASRLIFIYAVKE